MIECPPLGLRIRTQLLRSAGLDPIQPQGGAAEGGAAEGGAAEGEAAEGEAIVARLRLLADRLRETELVTVSDADLVSASLLSRVLRSAFRHWEDTATGELERVANELSTLDAMCTATALVRDTFIELDGASSSEICRELLLLWFDRQNPAFHDLQTLLGCPDISTSKECKQILAALRAGLGEGGFSTLCELMAAPSTAGESLKAQLAWIEAHWSHWLPTALTEQLLLARDLLAEETRFRGGGPGEIPVLDFGPPGPLDEELEAFTSDQDWMANVVLAARSTWVWLDQLSRQYERPIHRLDQIPDEELARLAERGFTGLWLIGLWERSSASAEIKRRMGNSEAVASAYSLHDTRIAANLGGEEAWEDLSRRAGALGIRLAADMVPNHVGLSSKWVQERPDFLLQAPDAPYPGYRFTGLDLSDDPRISIQIEDGYWDHSDAAVVFRREDRQTGEIRFIYHGNDGTHMPWNDTAQVDYLNAEAREAVIQEILGVARRFPIIRFDAAMTLARRHVRRLWYPEPGDGGAVPSRAERSLSRADFDRLMPREFWREVVDRVAAEAPDTLLLAEAFWMMEGYFVRTLGMHRVYNSAFMHMLKDEENAKYRQTIKNVLEHSPEILKRFVNFQSNPDEEPAAVQFGTGDKYFGVCTLMVTLPGLPMFSHGQFEGYSEKYGMEYRRARWEERPNDALIARHEREIVPLLKRRHLFTEVERFGLYDLVRSDSTIDENVFAFSNLADGEASLVVYNNHWERTAGRLDHSSSGDHLLTALGLPTNGLLSMREQRSGLERLVRSKYLSSEGFAVHLEGYQAQVFLDFRAIPASPEWLQLADELDGRSVPSLDAAMHDFRATPLLEQLVTQLSTGEPTLGVVSLALTQASDRLASRHLVQVAERLLPPETAPLAMLLATERDLWGVLGPNVRTWLGVNRHEGVDWFIAERMEELIVGWSALELERGHSRSATEARAEALRERVLESGYRLDRLLATLSMASTED